MEGGTFLPHPLPPLSSTQLSTPPYSPPAAFWADKLLPQLCAKFGPHLLLLTSKMVDRKVLFRRSCELLGVCPLVPLPPPFPFPFPCPSEAPGCSPWGYPDGHLLVVSLQAYVPLYPPMPLCFGSSPYISLSRPLA